MFPFATINNSNRVLKYFIFSVAALKLFLSSELCQKKIFCAAFNEMIYIPLQKVKFVNIQRYDFGIK